MSELLLVLGIDASGKSTFLNELSRSSDFMQLQQTTDPAIQAFKAQSVNALVDNTFVNRRESLFQENNVVFMRHVMELLISGKKIVLDGHPIVTAISHSVMRSIVTAEPIDVRAIVETTAQSSEHIDPNLVVVTYAPADIIRDRIRLRQTYDSTERFWGFNSPYFLNQYQDSLLETVDVLREAGMEAMVFDTSRVRPEDMVSAVLDGSSTATSNQ